MSYVKVSLDWDACTDVAKAIVQPENLNVERWSEIVQRLEPNVEDYPPGAGFALYHQSLVTVRFTLVDSAGRRLHRRSAG